MVPTESDWLKDDVFDPIVKEICLGEYREAHDLIKEYEKTVPKNLMTQLLILWGVLDAFVKEEKDTKLHLKNDVQQHLHSFYKHIERERFYYDDIKVLKKGGLRYFENSVCNGVTLIKNCRRCLHLEEKVKYLEDLKIHCHYLKYLKKLQICMKWQDDRDAIVWKRSLTYFLGSLFIYVGFLIYIRFFTKNVN